MTAISLFRVLADGQRTDRLQSCCQDHQTDDNRQDGSPYEQISKLHQLLPGFGAGLLSGRTWLLIWTAAPLRSLNRPDVTTSSPGLTPSIAT